MDGLADVVGGGAVQDGLVVEGQARAGAEADDLPGHFVHQGEVGDQAGRGVDGPQQFGDAGGAAGAGRWWSRRRVPAAVRDCQWRSIGFDGPVPAQEGGTGTGPRGMLGATS
ncbi:hypothetical protein GCM10010519_61040 [Streptomyces lactacystinicus]